MHHWNSRRNFTGGTATGNWAGFVKTDTTTQGTWHTVYGSDGYDVTLDTNPSPNWPSYVNSVNSQTGPLVAMPVPPPM